MKLTIRAVEAAVFKDDLFSFPVVQDGETHTIELMPEVQKQLALALMASEPVKDGTKPRLILSPTGIRTQKTSGGKIGLAFQFGQGVAVHFLLTQDESRLVREKLLEAEQMNVTRN